MSFSDILVDINQIIFQNEVYKKRQENLINNKFEVFIAQSKNEAKEIALNDIIPKLELKQFHGVAQYLSFPLVYSMN